ncbi:MAG: GNAT family N-acetyltransferase [Candidatus Angelobacter sp.]
MNGIRGRPGRPPYPFIEQSNTHQLEMVRNSSLGFVDVSPVPDGYMLRQLRSEDEARYDELFHLAFADEGRFQETIERTLAGGFFVVEHVASHELVASCVAMRGSSSPRHVQGQLGWLVTDPSHTRKGLGTTVSASVTNRLVAEGYPCPFLGTEDFRLAAISIYLNLGWRPLIYCDDMESRWRSIFAKLGLEFTSS